jgi:hypothetical protein
MMHIHQLLIVQLTHELEFRRNIMAKGQQKKNKEIKKPKQDKKVVVVTGSAIPKPVSKK